MWEEKTGVCIWDELVEKIQEHQVIPIIGHRIYKVRREGNSEELLYDYLAKRIADRIGRTLPKHANQKFSKAAYEFLKNGIRKTSELKNFLHQILNDENFIVSETLCKLARIKAFSIFINTAYDDFFAEAIKKVRDYPTEIFNYTERQNRLPELLAKAELPVMLEQSKATLVYHIFGNLDKTFDPALTEKDILECLISFKKNMELNKYGWFFQRLKGNSVLFMGCGYDDWLFRFFIRIITNEAFSEGNNAGTIKFIEDDFRSIARDPECELPVFLRNYQSKVYCSSCGKTFIDALFNKLQKVCPEEIIPEDDFPKTVFISFTGEDRPIAEKLVKNLEQDKTNVWYDEIELRPGYDIDREIGNSIRKCKVFIPLISENSKKIVTEKGNLKYHCREWEIAILERNIGNLEIFPVIVDGTNWVYDKFSGIKHSKIKDGERSCSDYKELVVCLLKIDGKTNIRLLYD